MTEDELHDEAHANADFEIRRVLTSTFDDSHRSCRAAVLFTVFADEVMLLDDAEDVGDLFSAMAALILERSMKDGALFRTAGSA